MTSTTITLISAVALVAIIVAALMVAAPRMSGRQRSGQGERSRRQPVADESWVETGSRDAHRQLAEAAYPVAEAGYPVAEAGYPAAAASYGQAGEPGYGHPDDGFGRSLHGRSQAGMMPVGNSAADELLEVVAQLRAGRMPFASPASQPLDGRFAA